MTYKRSMLALSMALALASCGDGGGQSFGTGEPVAAPPEDPPIEFEDPSVSGEVSFSDVVVHDPSVVQADGRFYVFGSHLAYASTEDWMNWEQGGLDGVENSPLFSTYESEIAEGIDWVGGNVGSWASDVIQLADGRFYFYYNHCALPETGNCVSRSYLGVAVSDTIEGPYEDIGLILLTGHVGDENPGINGENYDGNIHPNAIDPDVFFDKEGRLWMVYGSYSGGIWIMEMDPETGLAMPDQGYGTKLTGGFYSAIEGPYMLYSPATDYYYLFTSFGGYEQGDGYNMRIARSRNPNGPFIDKLGQDMIEASGAWSAIEPYGVKIMGGHIFDHHVGEDAQDHGYMAPGHNSAFYDETTGNHFLIFHTRFPNLGEGHSVRVHQMFTTEDGWLVASPHRYAPIEGDNLVDEIDAYGTYQFINHGRDINRAPHLSRYLTLSDDDVIGGDFTGTWRIDEQSNITLNIEGEGTFTGVAKWQYNDVTARLTPTFSLLSADGGAAWGTQLENPGVSQVMSNIVEALVMPASTQSNLLLPTVGALGASISWTSSHTDIISTSGIVNRPNAGAEDTTVTLTANIELDGEAQSKTFEVTVPARYEYNRVAHYSFDSSLEETLNIKGDGTVTGSTPDTTDGNITFQEGQSGQAAVLDGTSGIRLPDGLIDNYEYTVSMWLNPNALTQFTTAFFGAQAQDNWLSLVPWSWDGNTMLWSGSQVWYDASTGMQIPTNTWTHVAFSVKQGAVNVYVNGETQFTGGNFQDLFSAGDGTFAVGVNYFDIPFNGMVDELKVYEGALTATEITNLDITPQPTSVLIASAAALLDLGDVSAVREDLNLPPTGAYASAISWQSSNPDVISTSGQVTRPQASEGNANVILTATLSLDGQTTTKTFDVTVSSLGLPDPIAWYAFDNDNLADASGNQSEGVRSGPNLGAGSGTALFADGALNRALQLDGSYGVELPNNIIRDNTYSFMMWLNPSQLTQFTSAFFAYANTDSWVSVVPQGNDGVNGNTMIWSGTSWYDAGTGQQIPVNTWSHLAAVNNGGTLTVYINGEQVFNGTGFPDVFSNASVRGFAIGANFWDTPFNGMVDELMIFGEALTANDVARFYEQQSTGGE